MPASRVCRGHCTDGPTGTVSRWALRHPVAALLVWFFTVGQAVAFVPVVASSRGVDLPMQPFATASTWVGLLLPAYALTRAEHGALGARAYLRESFRPPHGRLWFAIPLVLIPLATLAIAAGTVGSGVPLNPAALFAGYAGGVLLQGCIHLLTNNLWEELVWTGFVQVRLQVRYTPLRAALVVAPLFALQHAALIINNPPLVAMTILVALTTLAVPYRATMAWLRNRTGSLLLVGATHAFGNATVTGTMAGAAFLPALYERSVGPVHLFAFAAIGSVVCVATRGALGGRDPIQPPAHLNDRAER